MGNFAARLLAAGQDRALAVISTERRLTYGELRREVAGQIGGLQRQGLRPGERVALLADSEPDFVIAYLAIVAAGLCVVPLPVGHGAQAWKGLLERVEPTAILASTRWRAEAERLGLPVLSAAGDTPGVPVEVAPSDLAALMFTSGTTGAPRAVMVTHANLEANTRDIVDYMGLEAHDRALAVLPFSYCYGASLLHTHLWVGASLVTESSRLPEQALDTLEREGCTGLAGVPSTYQVWVRYSTFLKRSLPSLRWLQQAGGKLPDPIVRQLREGLPGVSVYVMYGQTEATARLSYLPPELLDTRPGSIGRGLPSTRLRLNAPDAQGVGEIVAAGPGISPGYWRDPESTARRFRGGELYTGDLARADEEGFLYIVGRDRHFIKSAGHRINPTEVEQVLSEHPGVIEVAVVGVEDELLGEAVAAFVVGPATIEELLRHCRERLPSALVPTRLKKLAELPRGPAGKVLPEQLRL